MTPRAAGRPRPSQRPSRKGLLIGIGGLLLLGSLAGLQRFGGAVAGRLLLPTGPAQWIWIDEPEERLRPVAFFAVRDFALPRKPETATLLTVGDEEAVVFVNEAPVAGIRYAEDPSVRSYDVGHLLRAGPNRLLAELRSTRGVGGFLLRLKLGGRSESRDVVTDRSWQIFRHPRPGMFEADSPLADGEPPRSWGLPPAGRWVMPVRSRPAAAIERLTSGAPPVAPRRYRIGGAGGDWRPLQRPDRFSPALGSWVTFDWGRELVAYVALRLPPDPAPGSEPVGLIYLGARPPAVKATAPAGYLLAMPGQRVWLDATPRRFRYLAFVGLCELSGAEAYLVDPVAAAGLIGEPRRPSGAFGLRPASLATPLENEIWGQLHGLAGVARREER